ncbi:MAG: dihydrolipoyl dehydrogenase [Candidatus Sumerlaeota bacterium]
MSTHYDIAVIGTGPGGYIAALKAAQLGAKVLVVEKSKDVGGTCLNFGCIPSKALLASAHLKHEIDHAKDFGINVAGEVEVDWKKIQKRKDRVLRRLRSGIQNLFKARNIDLIAGHGRLKGKGKIEVEGKTYEADNIILAVGSVPARIPGWPEDPEKVCTSDEALHWKTLPESLLIVGGGVIGCEFACMMQALGVDVTVVEMLPRLLPEMDKDLGPELAKTFKSRKIAIHTDTKVDALDADDNGCTAKLSNGETIQTERVLVAVGRRPNTADVGLETVGLETDRGFLRVDEYMMTKAPGVYCIGDANGSCLLAHAASAQGVAAVRNALGHDEPFTSPIPGAVYTFPEVAGVGMTEQAVVEKDIPFSIGHFPIGYLGKAMAAGVEEGFVKVLRHRETDAIIGVHMLGHNVTECVAAAGTLLHTEASVEDMAEVVFAHPSISESVKEAAEDALGAALHLPPRKVIQMTD